MSVALSPLDSLATRLAPPRPTAASPSGGGGFNAALEIAREQEQAGRQSTRDAANQLGASALIQPVLAQLRESPFKSDLFSGGRGEEAFGQQLDTLLADRLASTPGFGPAQALAQRLDAAAGREVNTLG